MIPDKYKQFIITCLLVGLLAFGGQLSPVAETIFIYVAIFVAAFFIRTKNKYFHVIMICAMVPVALEAVFNANHESLNPVFFWAICLCILYAVVFTAYSVFYLRHISASEIWEVVNSYILIGYLFAILYRLVEKYQHGSFFIEGPEKRGVAEYVYFSFVTMTTVGYGDMHPTSALAQRLSVIQAIWGHFYFALVVAYLLNKLSRNVARP
jgi:hypothetical protein